jgi:hypothetical protein
MLRFNRFRDTERKKSKPKVQKRPCHAEITRTYCLGLGFELYSVHRRPSTLVQNRIRIKIGLMAFKQTVGSGKWCIFRQFQ